MNEFTKEELFEASRCLKYMIDGGVTPYSSLTIQLNKKIKCMIDNYCEHEPRVNLENDYERYYPCKKCKQYSKWPVIDNYCEHD